MPDDTSLNAAHAGTYPLGTHTVARVGFGAMQLERCAATPAAALALVRRAIELGVNHIDTAQFYADGFANRIIGEAVRETPGAVVVTKVGAEPAPEARIPLRPAQRPEQLRASIEDNLRSLGVEQLAVVNLRRLDVGPGLTAQGDQVVDLDDQLAVMFSLRDEGKIGAVGLSGVGLDELDRALPGGIVCVQNAYSLASRQYEPLLERCAAHGVAWVPFFPLGGAHFPGWPSVTQRPKVIEVAARLGITPSQLGLAWLLAHRPNTLLIPGTASIRHLEENIAVAAISLDGPVLAELAADGAQAH